MNKVRFIRTTIVEIELNPDFYPEGFTLEKMAESDIKVMKETGEYEYLFVDNVVSDEITYQVIE